MLAYTTGTYGRSGYQTGPYGKGGIFSMEDLFKQNEEGVWYDPSDLSTLFQDSAGTTPATAVEQPVGKILDKSGRGNHASQPTSAARPVLSARVNLLTKTEDFSDAVWVKTNMLPPVPNAAMAPDGTMTAWKIAENATNTYHYLRQSVAGVVAGRSYKYPIFVKAAEMTRVRISSYNGSQIVNVNVDLSTGEVFTNAFAGGPTTGVPEVLPSVDGWWELAITGTANITASAFVDIYTVDESGNSSHLGVSGNGIYIWHPDFRPADLAYLPYQSVNTNTDYDTVGFPKYLKFDGVDDFLVTNSIDFSATDEMTVWGGVRKLRDTLGIVAEFSTVATNPSSFNIGGGLSNLANWFFTSSGTVYQTGTTPATYTSPQTKILTGIGDISSDSAKLRINGSQVAESTGDQGTGNYGNYPLYIGMRGGTTLPFNGHLYGLVVRGKTTPLSTLIKVEKYMNDKTKAY